MASGRLKAAGAAAALALLLASAAAAAALGPDAAACGARARQTALLVNVRGFRARSGNVRVLLYGSDPAAFLARGAWLRRIDLPVADDGAMPVCVAVPGPGRYAVAVRHDENGDGRSDWGDGGGFSRNPQLALVDPRPEYAEVAIDVRPGVQTIDIVLKYRTGLVIGPVEDAR